MFDIVDTEMLYAWLGRTWLVQICHTDIERSLWDAIFDAVHIGKMVPNRFYDLVE